MGRKRFYVVAGGGLVAGVGLAAAAAPVLSLGLSGADPGPSTDGTGALAAAAGQEGTNVAPPVLSASLGTGVQAPTPPSGGPAEGVKVHAHWVIQVREPDGSLVSHREFENDFVGAFRLSRFLTRANSVGLWSIALDTDANATAPCQAGNLALACRIVEQAVVAPGANFFRPLSVTVNNSNAIVLSGSATVANSTTITVVQTMLRECPANLAPSTPCTDLSDTPFTQVTNQNVGVSAGQIVQATVTLSFS